VSCELACQSLLLLLPSPMSWHSVSMDQHLQSYLDLVGVGGHDCLSHGHDHDHPHNPKMPHQTVTELTWDLNQLTKQNKQLQYQLDKALEAQDEAIKAAEQLRMINKQLKRPSKRSVLSFLPNWEANPKPEGNSWSQWRYSPQLQSSNQNAFD